MKKKILIIDDDPDITEATKLFLESNGFKVIGETDPLKALENFNKYEPDLVILDIMMNEPDEGFFIAQKFKKLKPDCPLIIYSSVSKALGYEFGKNSVVAADEFIDKPAEPAYLLKTINKLLKPLPL